MSWSDKLIEKLLLEYCGNREQPLRYSQKNRDVVD